MNALEMFRFYKDDFGKYMKEHGGGYPTEPWPKVPFDELHGVRRQTRCCAYCRYGMADLDNIVCCVHPDRVVRDERGVINYMSGIRCNSVWTDVCDAWEERTSENEDLGEPK